MQDAEYLRLIEHIRENVLGFGNQLGGLKDQWVKVTGYAAPFSTIDLNLAILQIVRDLEAEREEVKTVMEDKFIYSEEDIEWKNKIIH